MDRYCVVLSVVDPDGIDRNKVVEEIIEDAAKSGRYLITKGLAVDQDKVLIRND